jgi:hypothetical protein
MVLAAKATPVNIQDFAKSSGMTLSCGVGIPDFGVPDFSGTGPAADCPFTGHGYFLGGFWVDQVDWQCVPQFSRHLHLSLRQRLKM